jgi:very-short-patch-repair endonuclease
MKTLEYNKSFASHPRSKFWSNRNNISPEFVSLNSHKKFWFDCECGHSFEKRLIDIKKYNSWCPYCCNPCKKLCENSSCNTCFEKSFASNELSKFFSKDKNDCSPRQIIKKSHKKYWFNCNCGHSFEKIISDITQNKTWCPYCSNPSKLLCNNINCILCFNKSFASQERAKNWSNKNKLTPREIFKSTPIKFWFNCDKCNNEFETRASHITNGSWCPKCRYKTEDKLAKILQEKYPNIIVQGKFDWCKNKKHLLFDFVLDNYKIIVELDGYAHFFQVAKWKTPEHNRQRDLYKMKCANNNGYSVIRILQEDVFFNKYNWLEELTNNINKICNENRVQNIYMCKNNEYKDFELI